MEQPTYVKVGSRWGYIAVVIDLLFRMVVSWAVADHARTDLCMAALQKAIRWRRPAPGLIHHSDRGCQYASNAYRELLQRHGIQASMSRTGDCWDNAVVESFFGRLKTEVLHRFPWRSVGALHGALRYYIDRFYNHQRLHSTLGYLSPIEFERAYRRPHGGAAA